MEDPLKGSRTGVFVGFSPDLKACSYKSLIMSIDLRLMPIALPANLPGLLPARISYFLDLKGPTICIDTACSSSLAAVHLACQSIRRGECEAALAGGIRIDLLPVDYGVRIGIESPDDSCRAFDDKAHGTGMGEGVGVVLLKPLYKAVEDGDHVYSVIKGSALNQDGHSMGITAPNAAAQEDVITRAWEDAQINPETIDYIEAHGTATKIGDPIEIQGITRAFRRYTSKKQFCAIASVKSNIGHLLEASGMPSLIKASLALKKKEIPPSINFDLPNREINFIDSPVYVNKRLKFWKKNNHPRRCGINSFGMGGTNCHLVLEEAPRIPCTHDKEDALHVFALSAKTKQSLTELLHQYQNFLSKDTRKASLSDICFTANRGRGHYNLRIIFIVKNTKELIEKIKSTLTAGVEAIPEEIGFYGKHSISVLPDGKIRKGDISQEQKNILDSEAEELVSQVLVERSMENLRELGKYYVRGADISWSKIYGNEQGKRVPLPVYQFEKHRCWVKIPEKVLEKVEKRKTLHYETVWVEAPIEKNTGKFEGKKILLFVKEKSGLADDLQKEFKKAGAEVTAREANTNEEFQNLFTEIKAQNIAYIVFMQTLARKPVDQLNELRQSQNDGVLCLYRLLRAAHESDPDRKAAVAYVSDYAIEVDGREKYLKPENAPPFGLMRVAEKEFPNINFTAVDIDETATADMIVDELAVESPIFLRAYRGGKRYIEQFRKVDFTTRNRKKIEIKEDGIYVITGGLGGVGLVMADCLAQKGRVNLALISRTGVPGGKEQQDYLRKIMATGTRVECIAGDCTDFRRMDKIMKGLRQKYGRIHGIIHSAGIIKVDTLLNRSEQEFLSVLSPKIEGTFILDRVTEEENLDFFILFSSVATVFPAIGQSDYAAANMYLDAYSHYRNKKNKNTLTINWVAWKDVGMAVRTGISQGFIFKALPIDKAMKGFDRVIQYPISNVLIGEINYSDNIVSLLKKYPVSLSLDIQENLNQKKEESSAGKKSKAAVGTSSVRLAGREDNNYTETEKTLAAIWGNILGFEELDIFASFYALGGDSILALQIVNSVNSEFKINLNISELLNYGNIASLAEMLDRDYLMYSLCSMPSTYLVEGEIDTARADLGFDFLVPVEKREYYPASSAQKRLFFLNQLQHIGISYNLPVLVKVKGKFDKNRFENAIRKLVEYHEALRTSFQLVDNELVQKVHDKVDFKVNYIQTNKYTLQEGDVSQLAKEFIQPFDLSIAPLFRIALITTLSEEEHLILYDFHHIIADGTSIQIFNAGFMRLYKGEKLSPLRIQYIDYTCWQNKLLETEQIKAQERYWLDVFSGEIPKLDLPTDFPRPSIFTFQGDTCLFKLGYEDTQRVKKMCAECSVTLFMNILAAFSVLLHKYTNQEDIIVGYGIGGRSHEDLQPIMGMFINTLAMRNQPRPQKTYKEFLDEVRENCLQAYQNQDIQFERLLDKIDLPRDPSRNPLFDVSMVIQNFERSRERIEENIFHECYFEKKTSMVDLTLFINEIDNEIHFAFEYYSAIFKRETIQRLSNYLLNILKQAGKNPQIPISDIDILGEEEKSHLLHTFNRTKAYYPEDKTINELFEQQAAKAPEAVAVTFQAQRLSYSGLNARANQLARVLMHKGVRPGSIVGMLFERSIDVIVGILGILKSGGAYLPIDPGYPLERTSYMLKDSKVKIVLTRKNYTLNG